MIKTFNDLYTHELGMLLSAETQMIDLLPGLAGGTDTAELRQALLAQVDACTSQRDLLRRLLHGTDGHKAAPVSRGMKALLGECTELLKSFPAGILRDAVMIAHMQRAEHYKSAAYQSVHDYAKLMGNKAAAEQLKQAAAAVTLTGRSLGAIAIQVDAEAYVDTRVEGT